MADFSKQQLNMFLDWAAEKGLMKASSARSLKSACNAVLAVIEDEEAQDVTKLDIDSAMQRYQNLHGFGVSPRTLQAYSQRVKYAINEFEKYNADRIGWRPSGIQRARQSIRHANKNSDSPGTQTTRKDLPPEPREEVIDASAITHQFPMRPNVVVIVTGIPFDVKRSEMARLTGFLSNLVTGVEEGEQGRLMLKSPPMD